MAHKQDGLVPVAKVFGGLGGASPVLIRWATASIFHAERSHELVKRLPQDKLTALGPHRFGREPSHQQSGDVPEGQLVLTRSTQDQLVRPIDALVLMSVSGIGTGQAVVRFYNKRGTAEQWIKEGKQAVKMTRLSCHRFRSNEVRLWLTIIAYNLGNLWRRLALPQRIGNWSLTSLQQRLVKTGGRLIKHARYYWLLLAESHLTRRLFASMLGRIDGLSLPSG